ncbi:hypothetical protein Pla52o_46120 [Novipirellula galeiformis]|uniref:Uncharacterized protein n=1 Tax=Novipirellula galeiformis TaxID=2528004 RepID=A0A5C6C7G0_9BACT|nr:hypothetical protein Pla52o_46120 [Novipirellula galeiformis]
MYSNPLLIPYSIRDFAVTPSWKHPGTPESHEKGLFSNGIAACHHWKRASQGGATAFTLAHRGAFDAKSATEGCKLPRAAICRGLQKKRGAPRSEISPLRGDHPVRKR